MHVTHIPSKEANREWQQREWLRKHYWQSCTKEVVVDKDGLTAVYINTQKEFTALSADWSLTGLRAERDTGTPMVSTGQEFKDFDG